MIIQSNKKLAEQKDDDERIPLHWALSYGHLDIVKFLVNTRNFDPDVQVC